MLYLLSTHIALFPALDNTQVTRHFLQHNYIPQRKFYSINIPFFFFFLEVNIALYLSEVVYNTTYTLSIEVSGRKEPHEVQQGKCKGLGWANSGTDCPENWRNSITVSVQGQVGWALRNVVYGRCPCSWQ